jgi:hypothetical protein
VHDSKWSDCESSLCITEVYDSYSKFLPLNFCHVLNNAPMYLYSCLIWRTDSWMLFNDHVTFCDIDNCFKK